MMAVSRALAIFDGIRKQVCEHLFHQAGIALDGGQICNLPIDFTALKLRLHVHEHFFH